MYFNPHRTIRICFMVILL